MTKKSELSVIDLDAIDVNKLPELANFKERGQQLVKECVFVEIKDSATYELAKKNRTALRTFRTDVEKSDKAIKAKLNNFKNRVGEVSASLIAITEPSEKTQQEEVERYEQIKENERLEKLRLEQERVDNIKKSISVFADFWNTRISVLVFSEIDDFETEMGEAFVNFDKSSLAEFEVLFDDQKKSIYAFFESKVAQLESQEEIRLEQIRLAEELEKQRIENERIAEEQRKERERIQAEQKAEAEKIRLAKEAFEKEKREFEEKQAEARLKQRMSQLSDIGVTEDVIWFGEGKRNWANLKNSAINESEEIWIKTLEWVKEVIAESLIVENLGEINPVTVEETVNSTPKSDESANEKEAETPSIGHSTRLKANTPMQTSDAYEIPLTWSSIIQGFKNTKDFSSDDIGADVLSKLESHLERIYNVPTPKI